jgi:hypothetical protein
MKKELLKIAGVKSEKEFYKKFPTEESFMAKHGKALKKAQIGAFIGGTKDAGFQPVNFKDIYDTYDYSVTGSTQDMREQEALKRAEVAALQKKSGGDSGIGALIGNVLQSIGGESGAMGDGASSAAGAEAAASVATAAAKRGKKIKKAQTGGNMQPEPQQQDYPDYNSWKADHDLWNQNQTYVGVGAKSNAPSSINNPALEVQEKTPGSDLAKMAGKYAGPVGKVIEGIQQLKEEKKALQRAQQSQAVSDVMLQASRTRPEQTQRRYVRPEDVTNTGEEFFPIYGVGTNVLAKNGKTIGGIPGEITNTFAPNTIYDNLGYEPLSDSERYKQFINGGKLTKAQDGLTSFAEAGGGDFASNLITSIGGENAGGNIGGTIGKAAGTAIGGPVGGMIGQVGGQLIGSLINRKPQKTKAAQKATQKNIQTMALQQGIQGVQGANTSFMKNGGEASEYAWISHTWQPQKIVKFGEHNVSDLLKPPADADMLRAGGHLKEYTPPSERAMSTERPDMELGGELQTHWGGYAEPMSYNPFLPDGGETIMFRGQSHEESDGKGNTGIGITYGQNPVEVERGEPAMKLKDGSTGDSSLVVFGNLKIPSQLLGDPNAKGKNFKRYVEKLSKVEAKQNKLVEKSVDGLDNLDVQTPFDRLKFNSLEANMFGANMKLKDIAEKKMNAAALQSAMNDTIEEFGLKTTDKGNIMAKLGASIMKAQTGIEAMETVPEQKKTGKHYGGVTDADVESLKARNPWYNWKNFNPEKKASVKDFQEAFNQKAKQLGLKVRLKPDGKLGKQTVSAKSLYGEAAPAKAPVTESISSLPDVTVTSTKPSKVKSVEQTPSAEATENKKKFPWQTIFNQVLPYLRPTDAEALDPNQLMGEMYALATNQLEPVRAQLFQPELSVPYDISLQDILNENEATFRAQQRILGYNPAAQSQLNAQKYAANQKVLGEQFRMNQAMKDQVFRENRNLLNQAKLQNLGTLDQQYVRQEQARSNTKATTQAALNSIAAKYAQNRLENRTLQTYENLYNYRFDPRFRAMNMNPLVDFEGMIANASPSQLEDFKKALEAKTKKGTKESKNGSIVKALKSI